MITESNYKEFFLKTLEERKKFSYPPFLELATLEYRNKDKNKAFDFITNLKNKLDLYNTDKSVSLILNPNSSRKYNQYYYKIIVKSSTKLRDFLNCVKSEVIRNKELSVIFE
jgi:primosomal protein N'